jgi:hypothetical protein
MTDFQQDIDEAVGIDLTEDTKNEFGYTTVYDLNKRGALRANAQA